MYKIEKVFKKENVSRNVIYGFALMSIFALIYYIVNFSELYFSSDGAAIVLLAKEQLLKKQFIPEGFCYSTGIFIMSPGLFIPPLMLFIKDWLLCREIAVFLYAMIMLFFMFLLYRKIGVNRNKMIAPCIALILISLPMGHYTETYYEAAYTTILLGEVLILFLLFKLLDGKKCLKKSVLVSIGLFLSVFFFNTGSMHMQAMIMIPIVAALVVFVFVEYCMGDSSVLKDYRFLLAGIILVVGAIVAFVSYKYLMIKVSLDSTAGGISFSTNINDNLHNIPQILLSFYNAISNCGLFSGRGILNCVNFVVFVIATFIVPILSILVYKKVENRFLRIYIIYTWISDFIVMYMIVFTTAIVAANRYYQTIFFHKLVLMALLVEYLLKHKIKMIRIGMISAICVTVILSHGVYIKDHIQAKQSYDIENAYSVTDYLRDNNLTYGYATFWNAYENTVLANGEITIAGVLPGGNIPYYWLTSRDWYNTELYSGRCFYLLAEGETIDEKFYHVAEEIKYFKGYTILIFEKNFLDYKFEEETTFFEGKVDNNSLCVDNNAYKYLNNIYLKRNGLQYGPYLNLEKGNYELMISGENIKEVTTRIAVGLNTQEIPHSISYQSDEQIVISFELSTNQQDVEIINTNKSNETAIIKEVNLEKQ